MKRKPLNKQEEKEFFAELDDFVEETEEREMSAFLLDH